MVGVRCTDCEDPCLRGACDDAREHHKYEERLSELSALSYPNDDEQLEEITLKKKKLALKDQMYSMMLQYQKSQDLSH